MRVITPSQMSPWEGTPADGSRYTAQQLRVMADERPHWSRFDDRMVKLTYPPASNYSPPTDIEVPCPIIAWTKDRKRVLIVAPAGDKIWLTAK